jgi:hypothetical protein
MTIMTYVYAGKGHCDPPINRLVVLRQIYVKAAMTRPGRALAKPAPYHRWVTVFALLAFFIQSFAVQTHIHEQVPAAKTAALPGPVKAPLKSQDPVDQCRLCQELVHGGSFITPSTVATPAGLTYIAAVFVVLAAPTSASATAFAWQSRAPPQR